MPGVWNLQIIVAYCLKCWKFREFSENWPRVREVLLSMIFIAATTEQLHVVRTLTDTVGVFTDTLLCMVCRCILPHLSDRLFYPEWTHCVPVPKLWSASLQNKQPFFGGWGGEIPANIWERKLLKYFISLIKIRAAVAQLVCGLGYWLDNQGCEFGSGKELFSLPTRSDRLWAEGGGGGAHRIFCLTLRRLMSYIYGAPILDVSRSHTTTQHSR